MPKPPRTPEVVVVGSFNVDHVWRSDALPPPGATHSGDYASGPGGKGCNQATACARSSASTAFVCALGEAQRAAAIRVAERLRAEGRAVELVLGESRPKRVLADADKAGARSVWLLGPDEAARGVVKVRDLATGTERDEPV